MDLEPQRPKQRSNAFPTRQVPRKPAPAEIEEEVVEGTTARDHKTEDFKDSPLKIFINTEVMMLAAAVILGIVVYLFFR